MSADLDTTHVGTTVGTATRESPVKNESDGNDAEEPSVTDLTDNTSNDADGSDGTVREPSSGLFERILVVTDGAVTGRAAVGAGLDLATTHDATVDALYVVDTTEHWDMAVERRERRGENAVDEAERRGTMAGVDVEKWFRYGIGHEETLSFAAAHDVDLIVIGSERRTGIDRLVHPETLPVRVQRGASVPVLVVGTEAEYLAATEAE